MRQRAYLYVRVSTDEQADKGYSQKHQDEQLRKHCEAHQIDIAGVYWEDYSGKTFNRPEFNKFLNYIKQHKRSANLLLFLKWDRFSRNVAESYSMIHQLGKLGIEPQAIEQPLDMSIPESKIMLAIYLAAPEVENDRRALNVIAGMRKAMKEGRHVNMAPRGYRNVRDEQNRPTIEPNKDAPIIRWVFEEASKGLCPIIELWRMARRKGLKIGKSQLWNLLRNPFYYGVLLVPAYKKEPAMYVKAVHEPLISETLFKDVQDVLNGRKRKIRSHTHGMKEQFPLRGFVICSLCGKILTASTSKGNGGHYHYYHCTKGCPSRIKADDINDKFIQELQKIKTNQNSQEYHAAVIRKALSIDEKDHSKRVTELQAEIEKRKEAINKARKKVLEGIWEDEDFIETKKQYQPEIERMERELANIGDTDSSLEDEIAFCTQFIANLPEYYLQSDLIAHRQIIGSIYPENFTFSKNGIRTNRLHAAIELIYRSGADSHDPENKKASENGGFSNVVNRIGFEPMTCCLEGSCSIQLSYRSC